MAKFDPNKNTDGLTVGDLRLSIELAIYEGVLPPQCHPFVPETGDLAMGALFGLTIFYLSRREGWVFFYNGLKNPGPTLYFFKDRLRVLGDLAAANDPLGQLWMPEPPPGFPVSFPAFAGEVEGEGV